MMSVINYVNALNIGDDIEDDTLLIHANDIAYQPYSLYPSSRDQRLHIDIKINGTKYNALVDSGAQRSCMDRSVVTELYLSVKAKPGYIQLAQSDAKIQRTGATEICDIDYGGRKTSNSFEVLDLPNKESPILLGMDILPYIGIYLAGIINPLIPTDANWESLLTPHAEEPEHELEGFRDSLSDLLDMNANIPPEVHCNLPGSVVEVPGDQINIKQMKSAKVNFVPHKYTHQTEENVQKWLREGHIYKREHPTQVNLPLLSTGEHDQTGLLKKVRTCLDLREVNYQYEQDKFVLPKIKEVLHNLQGSNFFSKLDLTGGFHHFLVHENSRHFFTFSWRGAQYSFKSAPFGLHSLTAQFQRVMANLLIDIEGVQVYVDDIVIASLTEAEHRKTVREVIKRLNEANFRLNHDKCAFAVKTVNILGVKVTTQGLKADPEKKKRMIDWPLPRTKRDLHKAVGLANYMRDHIPDFAHITKHFRNLMKGKMNQNIETLWTPELKKKWEELKDAIACSATLAYPVDGHPFHIMNDASDYGIGGCLFQVVDGVRRDILYFSKGLNSAQQKYGTNTKELLALVYSLEHFSEYIKGGDITLWTDHKALCQMNQQQTLHPMLARWIAKTFHHHFTIIHVPGKDNQVADMLSRLHEDTFNEKTMNEANKNTHNGQEYTDLETNMPITVSAIDWKLHPRFYIEAEQRFGKFTVDLFAAEHNAQTNKYYTKEQDAMAQKWADETNPWANPPWELIPAVLDKVIEEATSITICVPFFPNATWFTTFLSLMETDPMLVENTNNTFLKEGYKACGKTPWGVTLVAKIGPNSPYFEQKVTHPAAHIAANTIGAEPREPDNATYWDKIGLIAQYHNIAHTTSEETVDKLEQDGHTWAQRSEHVSKYIDACTPCLQNKIYKKGYHPLQSISAAFPGDKVQVDTIGPLLDSNRGNTYVLLWLDIHSSYVILRAMMDKSAATVARTLVPIMCEHGFPQVLQTDQGTEYVNTTLEEVVKQAPTEHLVSRPYQPKVLGANERSHRDLLPLLRKFVEQNPGNWCSRLPFVQMGHNLRTSRRHKSPRFNVYFGRRMNQLANYNETVTAPGTDETWQTRLNNIEEAIRPHLDTNAARYQEKMRAAYDRKYQKKYVNFNEGDIVMIRQQGEMNKLTNPHSGPYKIVSKEGNGYFVCNLDGTRAPEYPQSVNDELIGLHKAANPEEEFIPNGTMPEEEQSQFEKILEYRPSSKGNASFDYLLQWPNGERTWTHESEIGNVDVLTQFRQRKRRKRRQSKQTPSNDNVRSADTRKRTKRGT